EKNFLALQLLITLLETQEPQSDLLPLVSAELALIKSANKVEQSPVLGVRVDYRQLIVPKGVSEKRARLFRALNWMDCWQLDLGSEPGANQAFLLAQEFAANERLLLFWKEIDLPFSYLFGTVNGLSIENILPTIKHVLGTNPITIAEISDEHLRTFQRLAVRINPDSQTSQKFKLFWKRATLKETLAEIFGEDLQITQIEFAKVFNLESAKGRNLKLREALIAWQEKNPNSYPSHLIDCFRALLARKLDGRLPKFVNSAEWQNTLSTTVSVNWFAHQTLINAPEKSKTISGGSNRYHEDFHGYVEPNTEFFFALEKMSDSLRSTLIKLRIFIPELDDFIDVIRTLDQIVRKQL
ncbi:MAG: hypothetical protein FD167_5872, partial [bacterium]